MNGRKSMEQTYSQLSPLISHSLNAKSCDSGLQAERREACFPSCSPYKTKQNSRLICSTAVRDDLASTNGARGLIEEKAAGHAYDDSIQSKHNINLNSNEPSSDNEEAHRSKSLPHQHEKRKRALLEKALTPHSEKEQPTPHAEEERPSYPNHADKNSPTYHSTADIAPSPTCREPPLLTEESTPQPTPLTKEKTWRSVTNEKSKSLEEETQEQYAHQLDKATRTLSRGTQKTSGLSMRFILPESSSINRHPVDCIGRQRPPIGEKCFVLLLIFLITGVLLTGFGATCLVPVREEIEPLVYCKPIGGFTTALVIVCGGTILTTVGVVACILINECSGKQLHGGKCHINCHIFEDLVE